MAKFLEVRRHKANYSAISSKIVVGSANNLAELDNTGNVKFLAEFKQYTAT